MQRQKNRRCDHCHGRFGLVSHPHFFKRFCSKRCLNANKRDLAAAVDARLKEWWADLLVLASARRAPAIATRRVRQPGC